MACWHNQKRVHKAIQRVPCPIAFLSSFIHNKGMAQERHKFYSDADRMLAAIFRQTAQKRSKLAGKKLQTEKKALTRSEQKMLNTELAFECRTGTVRKVRKLLKAGANMESKVSKYGYAALHSAASNPDARICALLIKKGAKINEKTTSSGYTALMLAAMHGNTETCAFLIKEGANIEAKDYIGFTALFFAAQGDHPQTCALLLEKGADINARDKSGKTALQLARSNRKKETTAFLTLMTFAPRIFADKETPKQFYSDFRKCVGTR
jgi:ankyrin repeat protein